MAPSPRTLGRPGLYLGRPRLAIDVVEVVQQAAPPPPAHALPASPERLVMATERRDGKALAVHHRGFDLRARLVVGNRLNRPAELAVPDRGRQHALPAV